MLNLCHTPVRRKLLFTLLYFCEGAPIGFIWWLLPTRLRMEGVPVDDITLMTSLLVLPWALKFLWGPAVDSFQAARWNLKHWIVASQMIMAVSLVPLLFYEGPASFPMMVAFLFFHAFAAATQDVSIDALCIATVPEEERGSINGWMMVGMLGGRSLFGGVALTAATIVTPTILLGTMVALIFTIALFVSRIAIPAPAVRQRTVTETLTIIRNTISRRSTQYGLLFAVAGGFAYEGAGAVAGPFLVDRGVSGETIGIFFSLFSVGSMMAGAAVGGKMFDRIGSEKSVRRATLFVAASVFLLGLTDLLVPAGTPAYVLTVLTVVYAGIGIFTATSYALFMEVTDRRLGATQFSAFMGGTNLSESLAGFTAGALIVHTGYPAAFSLLAFISLLSLPLITKIRTGPHHSSD